MFSIVVFANEEQENIPLVVERLLELYTADKIIFVLDGKIEATAKILSQNNLKFIRGPDHGKGAAIRAAINNIDSEILIFMDADGSHDPKEIQSLLAPLINNEAEMVIGSRFLGKSDELYDNLSDRVRFLGNILGNFVINLLWNRTGKGISDAQNGFRGIKRKPFLALALEENGFPIEQEMVIKCLKKKYRICEVPSWERRRIYGQSHISTAHFSDYVLCIIKNILKH